MEHIKGALLKLVTADDGHFGHLKDVSPGLDVVYLHDEELSIFKPTSSTAEAFFET